MALRVGYDKLNGRPAGSRRSRGRRASSARSAGTRSSATAGSAGRLADGRAARRRGEQRRRRTCSPPRRDRVRGTTYKSPYRGPLGGGSRSRPRQVGDRGWIGDEARRARLTGKIAPLWSRFPAGVAHSGAARRRRRLRSNRPVPRPRSGSDLRHALRGRHLRDDAQPTARIPRAVRRVPGGRSPGDLRIGRRPADRRRFDRSRRLERGVPPHGKGVRGTRSPRDRARPQAGRGIRVRQLFSRTRSIRPTGRRVSNRVDYVTRTP